MTPITIALHEDPTDNLVITVRRGRRDPRRVVLSSDMLLGFNGGQDGTAGPDLARAIVHEIAQALDDVQRVTAAT